MRRERCRHGDAFVDGRGAVVLLAQSTNRLVLAQDLARQPFFGIHVVDERTGRGVPLIELETVNHLRFVTDSAGWIAFHEPGLMGEPVFFEVKSHGYQHAKDGFGFAGSGSHTASRARVRHSGPTHQHCTALVPDYRRGDLPRQHAARQADTVDPSARDRQSGWTGLRHGGPLSRQDLLVLGRYEPDAVSHWATSGCRARRSPLPGADEWIPARESSSTISSATMASVGRWPAWEWSRDPSGSTPSACCPTSKGGHD